MKTQIITLASHDDLISIRDRMSWAKSSRILLVWPAHEQVPLRPLDLRILQQHAAELGAQIGLVTRRGGIRRDAESFGIPVFGSTAEAQREPWSRHHARSWRRAKPVGNRTAELRAMKGRLGHGTTGWSSRPVARIGFFSFAVLAVFGIASVFVPRATIVLKPITMEQHDTIAVQINATGAPPSVLAGGVAPQIVEVSTSGSRTMRVQSRAEMPKEKANGIARFQNLTQSPVGIPAGTVVYSVTPSALRFATLVEAQLEGRASAFVEVPIEALEAGGIGNVPAGAIQGIEGSLGASTLITNPEPTQGGLDAVESVPSQVDRDQLRASLLEELEAQAKSKAAGLIAEDDVILPGSLILGSIDQEIFDPPAGRSARVLSLALSATYHAKYIQGADLRRLAEVTLDASMPPQYTARESPAQYHVTSAPTTDDDGGTRFNLEVGRTIVREIDVAAANQLVRGRTPKQALGALQAAMPLAAPPEIRLTPSWWPRLPLIPFRIVVVIA